MDVGGPPSGFGGPLPVSGPEWGSVPVQRAYPGLEDDATMRLDHAQFEALFAGLDRRRVRALSVRPPAEAE